MAANASYFPLSGAAVELLHAACACRPLREPATATPMLEAAAAAAAATAEAETEVPAMAVVLGAGTVTLLPERPGAKPRRWADTPDEHEHCA